MKTALLTVLAPLMLFAQAQPEEMNIVKTNVTAYAFRNINVTYERVINRTFSLSLSYGTVPKGSIPYSGNLLDDTEFSNAKVSQSQFTLEPRIYLGQGYGKGFYLAPYYRHTKIDIEEVTYDVDYETGSVPTRITGNANGNSGGLMVGAQWFLGQTSQWVLDFWIIGAHYGNGKGDLRAASPRPLTPMEQAELQREIENLDIPFVEYTVSTDATGANIRLDGPWAGIRSGLSVGYRF
ncbi:DUF3575 domain-containing protein [Chryseobacterium sp. 6424]|uniref:DUF3575 domain-containing protein n=1 Tax=Chryseobacterium sp. 6424 TaxID=2039166 RepID=UPI000EFC6C64|nr:DUF3575 domain-containing protein [Chryseobacterium sp. 6424]AYO57086.1 DUF3575 domain-containing protein [Chryseobacterium sp. 6424]